MIVQSLCHQVQGQRVFSAASLLDFGPLVLKPDLDLGFVQAQFLRQVLSPLLRQIPICLKLRFESLQLFCCEGRPWSLVLFAGRFLLWFPRSWPCSVGRWEVGFTDTHVWVCQHPNTRRIKENKIIIKDTLPIIRAVL